MSAHDFGMDKLARYHQPADSTPRWETGEDVRAPAAGAKMGRFLALALLAASAAGIAYAATTDWSTGTTVSARLVVERRDASGASADSAFLDAQAKLIASRDLLRRAAGELGVDSAFLERHPSLPERVLAAVGIGGAGKLTSPEERLTEALAARFQAVPSGYGRAIDISFEADSADLATRFVGRVVEDYIALQREAGGVEARLQADATPVVRVATIAPVTAASMAGLGVLSLGLALSAFGWWRRRRARVADVIDDAPLAVDPMEHHDTAIEAAESVELPAPTPEPEAADVPVVAPVGFGGRKRIAVATLGEGGDTHRLIEELAREGGFEGARIVVVDAGRRSSDHLGLSDLLAGDAAFADVIQRNPASRAHEIGAGRRPLASLADDVEAVTVLLEALEQTYDLVLIDLGALRADPAFTLLARLAGQLVLAGDADRGAVDTLLAALNRRGVTGIVRVPLFDGDVAAVA